MTKPTAEDEPYREPDDSTPPLVKFRGAVLARARANKVHTCQACRRTIALGDATWFPLVENSRISRVNRSMRWCGWHFEDGDVRNDPRTTGGSA